MEHTEEVTSLVRDAVDRRVRLYIDCLHKRGQPKHKRELPHANPLCVKGRRVSLVANFVKRHFNLRCIVKQQYGELRVFPERYVVCVSRLEDVSANPTPAVTVTVVSGCLYSTTSSSFQSLGNITSTGLCLSVIIGLRCQILLPLPTVCAGSC
eukprot:XP_014013405.1 PREDICTED: protein SLX4IP isoform X2 [Salmo salar]